MPSDPALPESDSLSNLSGEDTIFDVSLSPSPSRSSGALSCGCPSSVSASGSEATFDRALIEHITADNTGYSRPAGAVLELLGLPDFLKRVIDFFTRRYTWHSPSELQGKTLSLKRLFLFVLWTLGCISLDLVSGLLVFLLPMLPSRILSTAARLGLVTLPQTTVLQKDDAYAASVLQDRLEVANLAVKQLKSEGLALQERLKAAGARISRLEASQSDFAAYQELRDKYAQVSTELARATKENEDLKSTLTRLGKENAELRQCIAISSPDSEDEANHLGMLARLQNQRLDSCIFSNDLEMGQGESEIRPADASEDSIIIVTSADSPTRVPKEPKTMSIPLLSTTTHLPSIVRTQHPLQVAIPPSSNKVPQLSSGLVLKLNAALPPAPDAKDGIPIPVFTTKRPSLPPKASKLKPLLLTSHSAGPGTPRHHGRVHFRMRRDNHKQQERMLSDGLANNQADGTANASANTNDQLKVHTLNPRAPAFTPRNLPVKTSTTPTEINPLKSTSSDASKSNSESSKAVSPSSSPFIITSPSPNSPFLRPPPQRRQSEEVPTLTTTPPTPTTPITPIPVSSAEPGTNRNDNNINNNNNNKGTPRSTRATSVKLIRARAALRNSQRLASGSNVVMPASPAGFKTLPASGKKNAKDVKARLIGKGLPPRRVLGEVTNAELGTEVASSRWTSV